MVPINEHEKKSIKESNNTTNIENNMPVSKWWKISSSSKREIGI